MTHPAGRYRGFKFLELHVGNLRTGAKGAFEIEEILNFLTAADRGTLFGLFQVEPLRGLVIVCLNQAIDGAGLRFHCAAGQAFGRVEAVKSKFPQAVNGERHAPIAVRLSHADALPAALFQTEAPQQKAKLLIRKILKAYDAAKDASRIKRTQRGSDVLLFRRRCTGLFAQPIQLIAAQAKSS